LEKGKISIQYVEVPVDPQLEEFEVGLGHQKMLFSAFDVLSGEFLDKFGKLTKRAGSISEDDARKTKGDLEGVLDRLSQISCANVFFIDPVVDTMKMVDVLRDEFSKVVHAQNSSRHGEDAQGTV